MKRFHVHVAVEDLSTSTRFYSALFGAQPTVEKPDYAKWMLDDPRVNFAISHRGSTRGVNHLGFQVDSDDELDTLQKRHDAAELSVFNEGNTQCCYAQSKKHWVTDPQGIAWEMYRTMGEAKTYNGEDESSVEKVADKANASACCSPPDQAAPAAKATASKVIEKSAAQCSTACCPAPALG